MSPTSYGGRHPDHHLAENILLRPLGVVIRWIDLMRIEPLSIGVERVGVLFFELDRLAVARADPFWLQGVHEEWRLAKDVFVDPEHGAFAHAYIDNLASDTDLFSYVTSGSCRILTWECRSRRPSTLHHLEKLRR